MSTESKTQNNISKAMTDELSFAINNFNELKHTGILNACSGNSAHNTS